MAPTFTDDSDVESITAATATPSAKPTTPNPVAAKATPAPVAPVVEDDEVDLEGDHGVRAILEHLKVERQKDDQWVDKNFPPNSPALLDSPDNI